MILLILEEQTRQRKAKKQNAQHDCGVKKNFIQAAFGAVNIGTAAKHTAHATAFLLEQDHDDNKYGQDNLYDVEQGVHNQNR